MWIFPCILVSRCFGGPDVDRDGLILTGRVRGWEGRYGQLFPPALVMAVLPEESPRAMRQRVPGVIAGTLWLVQRRLARVPGMRPAETQSANKMGLTPQLTPHNPFFQ